MPLPTEPGTEPGQMFFGGEDPLVASHMWDGEKWVDQPYQRAPIGLGEIPADLANSPHSDVSLGYTLQNFNALVAANTAMKTELSAAAVREADLRAHIATLESDLQLSRESDAEFRKLYSQAKRDLTQAESATKGVDEALQFALSERDALQRRLDRSLGYLDRVLDDEEAIRAPATHNVPAQPPAAGPDLSSIPEPRRRRDGDSMYGIAQMAEPYHSNRRHRRF